MPLDERQACAATTYGSSIAVMAGAGSGKTQTMKERVADAFIERSENLVLENGAVLKAHGRVVESVSEVLAITFTEAAASELKDRIKGALRASEDESVRAQALLVDDAWISTIHGMCSRLLRENAFTLGVDPQFTTVSESQRSALLDEAIEEALAASAASSELLQEYPCIESQKGTGVHAMVAELISTAVKSPQLFASFVLPPVADLRTVLELLQAALANDPKTSMQQLKELDPSGKYSVAGLSIKGDGVALARLEELLAKDQVTLEEAWDVCEVLSFSGNLPDDKTVPVLEGWGGPWADGGPYNRRNAVELCVLALQALGTNQRLSSLMDIAQDAYARFQDAKRARGMLDYDDMLLRTYEALQQERIQAQYRDKFKLVIVDEFQDTNQLQLDIIRNFTGQDDERLCVVGDRMQSIYRFQGADVAVCNGHLQNSAREVLTIDNNYRSHERILSFVDTVFSDMGTEYLHLNAARMERSATETFLPFDEAASGPRVSVFEVQQPSASSVKQTTRQLIAHHIAATFKRMHDETGADGKQRPYGDMVILLSVMTNADVYADALRDAGIPCAIVKGSVMKKANEAKMLLQLLTALADPANTEALFRVLVGPMFALSDQDFVDLSLETDETGRSTRSLARAFNRYVAACESGKGGESVLDGLSPRAVRAVVVLGNARMRLRTQPVHAVLDAVVAECGILERMKAGSGSLPAEAQAQAANLLKVIRLVEDMEQQGVHGPAALSVQLDDHIENTGETPGNLAVEAGDFVRIMTIHASKGLSFPVVALGELRMSNHSSKLFVESTGGKAYALLEAGKGLAPEGSVLAESAHKMACGLVDPALVIDPSALDAAIAQSRDAGNTGMYAANLEAFHAQQEAAELERKIYVGMTRPEEALVVTAVNMVKVGEIDSAIADSPLQALFDAEGLDAKKSRMVFNVNGLDGKMAGSLAEMHRKRTAIEQGGAGYTVVTPMWLEAWVNTGVLPPGVGGPEDARMSADGFDLRTVQPVEADSPKNAGAPQEFVVYEDASVSAPDRFRFANNWSNGIVSASSVKAAAAAEGAAGAVVQHAPSQGSDVFADEGDLVEEAPLRADSTARGLAFHALCEWAAGQWCCGQALAMPPEERIVAVCAYNGLSEADVALVTEMLKAWLASGAAQQCAACDHLVAEAPFFLQLNGEDAEKPLFVNGFIDLLAYDGEAVGATAHVVDYKTGRSLTTSETRRAAYEVQAQVYAYALLQQGFAAVDLQFVFVEQSEAGAPPVEVFPATGACYTSAADLRSQLLKKIDAISLVE